MVCIYIYIYVSLSLSLSASLSTPIPTRQQHGTILLLTLRLDFLHGLLLGMSHFRLLLKTEAARLLNNECTCCIFSCDFSASLQVEAAMGHINSLFLRARIIPKLLCTEFFRNRSGHRLSRTSAPQGLTCNTGCIMLFVLHFLLFSSSKSPYLVRHILGNMSEIF